MHILKIKNIKLLYLLLFLPFQISCYDNVMLIMTVKNKSHNILHYN